MGHKHNEIMYYGSALPPTTGYDEGTLFLNYTTGDLYVLSGSTWTLIGSGGVLTSVQNDGTGVALVSDTGTAHAAKVRSLKTTGNGITLAISASGEEVELSFDKAAASVASLDSSGKVIERLSYEGIANGVATLDKNAIVKQFPHIPDVATLRAIDGSELRIIYLRGYRNDNDGGEGFLYRDPLDLTTPDNGGTVFVDAAGNRWKRKSTKGVRVGWFGATGDGITDDTSAIQSAIDSSENIFFDSGTYYITSTLLISASKTLKLAPGAKIITPSTISSPAIKITASDVTVLGGSIDLQKSSTTVDTNVAGIEASSADNLVVRGVSVTNSAGYGIWVYDSNNVKVNGCIVTDTNYIGIFIQPKLVAADMLNIDVSGNRVDRSSLGAGISEGGIKIRGDGTNALYYARVTNNHVVMPSSPTSTAAICIELWGLAPKSIVANNTTVGGSMGISVDSSTGVTVTANTVDGPSVYGIELAASPRCAVVGNTIDGASIAQKGVALTGASAQSVGSTIVGNTIINVNGNAIYGYSGSHQVTCSGNNILAIASYAINVEVSDGWTIVGNQINCQSLAKKGVFLNRSSKATIAGNTILDYTETGVMLYSGVAYNFDHITISGNVINSSVGLPVDKILATGSTIGNNVRFIGNNFQNTLDYGNNVKFMVGSGSPEGVYAAGVGSIYLDRAGGTSTTLYVKESGTGNTGWVAK